MKKIIILAVILIAVAVTFGAFSYASAQKDSPPDPEAPFGPENMGWRHGVWPHAHGMMGGYSGFGGGLMHDSVTAALAEALGISEEKIETRFNAGESHWEIAASGGLNEEDIIELMSVAQKNALQDAVEQGLLTQDQADWMQTRMKTMWSRGYGGYGGHCGGRGWNYKDINTPKSGYRGMGY